MEEQLTEGQFSDGQATRSVTLVVEGMGCGGCAARIEDRLKRAPGVRDASVSFERGEAVVHYDPASTAPASLTALISGAGSGAGYTVTKLT